MPTVLQGQVLCFPHIEFPDTTWLKAALCLWDRVHRIVPPGYRPKDDDEVKKAIDEGLVVDLNLTERDLSTTRTNFLEILGPRGSPKTGQLGSLQNRPVEAVI